jgi:ATP-dependent Zn protease
MVKLFTLSLILCISLILFTDNNYFNLIPSNILKENIKSNTTIYSMGNQLCLLDYTNILGNKFYNCSTNILAIPEKINISENFINHLEESTEYMNWNNFFYLLIIYFGYKFVHGIKSFGFNNSEIKVKKFAKDDNFITSSLDNFIGCSNIKNDIENLITQIKFHDTFTSSNCNLPKGILLLGPPGCGKTHLVKTIINSTEINYIFSSGSDFNRIYVGAGSLMIEQIFKKARENKPCLIFIDEADTIIRKRENSNNSSQSESNSSLCKLLAEMDSINTESGIVVIFATNMDEKYIDKALMRSGRVDKILHITEPTFEERKELFKLYLEEYYDESLIDLDTISKLSGGLTGSDIKKIINSIKINKISDHIQTIKNNIKKESNTGKKILLSLKFFENKNISNKKIPINEPILFFINTKDIDKEINKCIMGLERERPINAINKKLIAYHETGHAIMSFLLKDTVLPTKICISITSKTLGYTMYLNDDEDIIMSSSIKNLMRQVMILYSGRSSEKIFMNEITCGAEDDYIKARKILGRLLMNGMLIPELNLINTDIYTSDNKIPKEIDSIMSKINKYLLEIIEEQFNLHADIINKVQELIVMEGSITGDDIQKIFESNNKQSYIHSIDIEEIIQKIEKIIEINYK